MQQADELVCPAAAGSTQSPLQNHEIDPLPSYRVLNIQKFINGTSVWLFACVANDPDPLLQDLSERTPWCIFGSCKDTMKGTFHDHTWSTMVHHPIHWNPMSIWNPNSPEFWKILPFSPLFWTQMTPIRYPAAITDVTFFRSSSALALSYLKLISSQFGAIIGT